MKYVGSGDRRKEWISKERMPYTTRDHIIVVRDGINVVTEPLQHINYLCAFEKGNFLHLRKKSERKYLHKRNSMWWQGLRQ